MSDPSPGCVNLYITDVYITSLIMFTVNTISVILTVEVLNLESNTNNYRNICKTAVRKKSDDPFQAQNSTVQPHFNFVRSSYFRMLTGKPNCSFV